MHDEIKQEINNEPKKIQVSRQLNDLVQQIKDSQEKNFVESHFSHQYQIMIFLLILLLSIFFRTQLIAKKYRQF